jgi:hypothetical protein
LDTRTAALNGEGKAVQQLMRLVIFAGTIAATVAGTGIAAADKGPVQVAFSEGLRMCDFHQAGHSMGADGQGYAWIGSSGNTVHADIRLEGATPDEQHMVRLIVMPRNPMDSCAAGGPGVVVGPLYTDAGGNGSIHLEEARPAGATGAWVLIEGPHDYSHPNGQLYTSDFIAPV